jgi:hypothetical protein
MPTAAGKALPALPIEIGEPEPPIALTLASADP